ncbi:MAG TPA: DUF6585 family protein [Polyangiaceae bacterium]|nr:DUF6585 family protein [Polyangiaceae bacterium]
MSVTELGAPIRVYLPQTSAAAFLGVLFVLGGVALPWYVWHTGGFAEGFELRSLLYLFPLVLGLTGLKSAYGNWRKAAVVYQGGLAYSDNDGPRSIPWSELSAIKSEVIKHYRNGMYVGTTHRHELTARGQPWLVLTKNDFPDVAELAEQIGQGIFPQAYRASRHEWDAVRWLTFGPVSVNKTEGIRVQGETYAWSALTSLTVEKGCLHIVPRDPTLWSRMTGKGKIDIALMPNFPVLMAIVEKAGCVPVSRPSSR